LLGISIAGGVTVKPAQLMAAIFRRALIGGALEIKSWRRLAEIGQFDPHYLHLRKPPL
jgi:hypothetical protein